MKTNVSFRISLVIATFTILLIGCSKEDDKIDYPDPFISEFIEEINADSLKSYVELLQGMQTRFMLASNRKTVAQAIQKKFINLGYTNTQIDSFSNTRTFNSIVYQTWQYNVVATIEGTVRPNDYCIVGAHYDCYTRDADLFTISPGANDNASGVAATMEIARLIQKKSFSPNNTIQFVAFAAEELGLYGSWDFADKASISQKNISMMLNFDMIAHWPGIDSTEWTVNILDYENSSSLRLRAQKICSLYTNLSTINDNTNYNRSDSYLFYRYGYEALFFASAAADDTYHTTNDIVSNCNFDYCREVTKASCALLIDKNK